MIKQIRTNVEKILARIKCKLGVHTFDFEKYPMQTQKVQIDGYDAYLSTYKCASCGKVFRELEFVDDLCKASIVEDLRYEDT